MKIAIHDSPGSFSDGWIEYCQQAKIDYRLVNCYSSDIIAQLHDCNALMWHHKQNDGAERLFAKQLLFAVQHAGLATFPDARTFWHFDDKVAQKYLFESIGAPLVPSHVFFSKREALQWVKHAEFPKVFKLRGGAGSASVYLVRSSAQAKRLVAKMFGSGISAFDPLRNLREQVRKYRENVGSAVGILKGLYRCVVYPAFARTNPPEQGYIYFQDFIPNNDSDTRVIIIDRKAIAIKRMVRTGDFRASGSGHIFFEKEHFPVGTIKLAFDLTERLQLQCAAFDFVYDATGKPMVLEVSYGFVEKVYRNCVGYWDEALQFHEGPINPSGWMIESLVRSQPKLNGRSE